MFGTQYSIKKSIKKKVLESKFVACRLSCFFGYSVQQKLESPFLAFTAHYTQKSKTSMESSFQTLPDTTKKQKREKKRSSLILPKHIGRVFFVHNGKSYSSIHIYRKMLGHKFGEFASTRKKPLHKKKK